MYTVPVPGPTVAIGIFGHNKVTELDANTKDTMLVSTSGICRLYMEIVREDSAYSGDSSSSTHNCAFTG